MVYKIHTSYSDKDFENCVGNSYDIKRIIQVALEHGVFLTPDEADRAWNDHSEIYAAGWLMLPENDNELWYELPAWARGE